MKSFEDLEVYKKSFNFTVAIFQLTEKTVINKNIIYQLERAALSIANNIAEGFELQSNKQFIKFLYIAKGSCGECSYLLAVANKLNQINNKVHTKFRNSAFEISKQLSNFIKYLNNSEIY